MTNIQISPLLPVGYSNREILTSVVITYQKKTIVENFFAT